ncbi:hypothetical protein QYF61_027010 [Mycteria americana]|uniref:Uncharacterized protein n=1 Tax=Mycteria americana TaxID=33587 RepID=A0AAN7QAF5_MYCAM|nr:hypothetical protein QYF61_027010 [Mycteria americana]
MEETEQLSTLPRLLEDPSVVGLLRVEEQQVPIATTVHQRQYRTNRDSLIPIHKLICRLESQEVISKTRSPFNSPIRPVQKSNGDLEVLQQVFGVYPMIQKAKQSQLPQPLLIRLLLQTLHQLHCPSLHTLQYLNIPLVVGGPKLNTGFEVRPHQCRVQGHNHFPSPAGHAIFDTSQDAIGFLGRLGTLLAHIQAAVNQHPQVLLCQEAFQPLFPKPVALHGVAVAQV